MTTTDTRTPRQMATLDMRRISLVDRASNRAQLLDDEGNPTDGWVVMKSDGTPVDLFGNSGAAEVETPAAPEFVSKADVHESIYALAEEVRKADPTLTREQAVVRVYNSRPDLVRAYQEAPYVAPVRVERAAPPELPGHEHVKKMNDLADEYQERTGASRDKALSAVLKSAEGVELTMAYKSANGWL